MSKTHSKDPLDISYDAEAQRLVITTPGGLVVHVQDPRSPKQASATPDLVITPEGDSLRLNAAQNLSVNSMGTLDLSGQEGVTITSGADVTLVADNNVTVAATETLDLKASDIAADAKQTVTAKSGTKSTLTSDGDTAVDGDMIYIG
ncbi:hypothetical protein C8N43_0244 [Litoreibacter ponti]|uniref:DUF2345 domain-containing protein n=1 Tax=Litoreibacter ponti TaxID=1510457 RepID=A0A2T6BHS1_9RHOB|nr:hypothetical protein [Litoreibacter ponti]PTX55605.1 hypothetical protein C8N43_0244 [Litoreibacter ponti]